MFISYYKIMGNQKISVKQAFIQVIAGIACKGILTFEANVGRCGVLIDRKNADRGECEWMADPACCCSALSFA
jgi:hypothetical protein